MERDFIEPFAEIYVDIVYVMDFISVNSLEYIGVEGTVLYSRMEERKKN